MSDDELMDALGVPDPRTAEERLLLDAIRAYGDARSDVAYGRATRKAIDLAWDAVLAAGNVRALAAEPVPAPPASDDEPLSVRDVYMFEAGVAEGRSLAAQAEAEAALAQHRADPVPAPLDVPTRREWDAMVDVLIDEGLDWEETSFSDWVIFAAERFGLITERDGSRCPKDAESLAQVAAALATPPEPKP